VKPPVMARLPLIALLGANTISLVGNQLTFIASPWFILQTTGSPARAGFAAACAALASALTALFGGPLVDRWGYRRTSVAADLASGLAVGLIPLLHGTVGLAFWQLVLLIVAGALLDAPGAAAREGLLPNLAAHAGLRLERVNAVAQALWRVAGLLGPALAGLLLASLGPGTALALDAATFAISAALLATAMPWVRRERVSGATPRPSGLRAYHAELRAGLDYLRRDRVVLILVLGFTALNALGEPLFALVLPVSARQERGGAVDLGLLLAAFAGGGLLGTGLFGAWGHRAPRRHLYGGGILLAAVALAPLLFAPPLPVLLGALALCGTASAPPNLLVVTVAQERIPAHLRARVFGVGRALALAALPLGLAVVGALLERVGTRGTVLILAVIQGLLALGLLAAPTLQALDRRSGQRVARRRWPGGLQRSSDCG